MQVKEYAQYAIEMHQHEINRLVYILERAKGEVPLDRRDYDQLELFLHILEKVRKD